MTSGGDGYDDSKDSLNNNNNVVPLKVPRQKRNTNTTKKETAETTKPAYKAIPKPLNPTANGATINEPLINLPPVTKYFLGLMVVIHLGITFLLNETQTNWLFIHLGFIPGRLTGTALFEPLVFITPLTHMFIHGSWLHIAMNGIMLLAFGSGIEKWLGGKKMLILFFISGLFGIATHFALNYDSIFPVVGASGGLSGLFAAALIMINKQQKNQGGPAHKIWPFILLWIGISVIFGFIGSPDGGQIAWAAHVGGFLGGFAAMKLLKKL